MDLTDNRPPFNLDQPPPARLASFVDIAKWQSARAGDAIAFTFLTPGREEPVSVTYGELDRRIRAAAVTLGEHGSRGDRVLIVQQPGIDYITSLFACMYAGMIAVPIYPLDAFRLRHTLPRLQAIARDCDATILMTGADDCIGPLSKHEETVDIASPDAAAKRAAGGAAHSVVRMDRIDIALADCYRGLSIGGDDVALLQYTSGTTGSPRGVVLRHRHLLANARQIYSAYHVPDAVCVFWLPPYHDMGLVGGLLLPMFAGRRSVLMSPTSFVQQPLAWLEAISHYRGTTTAAPNFGYELCLRKIGEADAERLDLSSLRVAIAGAEPIRASTVKRFSQRFAARGFDPRAFTPAYGMAEATLAITGKPPGQRPTIQRFERQDAGAPSTLVGCGVPLADVEVIIVDPESRRELPPGEVGEIWVRGPAVADSYWRKPEFTSETFGVRLADDSAGERLKPDSRQFLRTGDLGRIADGQLFVSGRIKDVVIVAGRNYFAHELEAAIQNSGEAFKVDGGAVFTATASSDSDEERLIVVQEVLRPRRYDLAELAERIRVTLAEQFELSVATIQLVPAGTLSKTSSGKLQRGECRKQWLAGELAGLYRWDDGEQFSDECAAGDACHPPSGRVEGEERAFGEGRGDQKQASAARLSDGSGVKSQLAAIWCEVLGLERAADDQHFLDFGGHSLAAVSLLARIRDSFGLTVDVSTLFACPHFGSLAAELERRLGSAEHRSTGLPAARSPIQASDSGSNDFSELELTPSQRRFWLLDQLDQTQAFLHLQWSLLIRGPLDFDRLEAAIRRVIAVQPAFRARFFSDAEGRPRQRFDSEASIDIRRVDLRDVSNEREKGVGPLLCKAPGGPVPGKRGPTPFFRTIANNEQDRLRRELVETRFDLAGGPLGRVVLVVHDDNLSELVFVAHHIACDAASAALLTQQIARSYNDGEVTAPPIDSLVAAAKESVDDAAAVEYWRRRLQDASPDPQAVLSTRDRRADEPAADLESSRCLRRVLPATIATELLRCSREWQVTPFEILLTAWHRVLAAYGDGNDVVFGVPVSGRDDVRREQAIGCLINILPVRLPDRAEATFRDTVARVSELWRGDLSHSSLPFETIVESAGWNGCSDALPVLRHLVLHQPPLPADLCFGEARCEQASSDYSTLAAYDTALVAQWSGRLGNAVEAAESRLELGVAFSPQRVDETIAANLLDRLMELLDRGLSRPDLPLALRERPGDAERMRITQALSAEENHCVDSTVVEMFHRRVRSAPDQVAVIDSEGSVTFEELDRRSTQLAERLIRGGVAAGEVVALRLGRSRRMIEAALAVWKAGAAYLPLDPSYPSERIELILNDARPSCILEDAAGDIRLGPGLSDGDGHRGSEPRSFGSLDSPAAAGPAYLIYTSGSTGVPKGVIVGHESLANLLLAFHRKPGLPAQSRMLASTTMSFDISVLELFLPLVSGAVSLIAPRSLSEDPDAVLDWLARHPIDVIQATPSSYRLMLAAGWQPEANQTLWCGGEPLQPDLAQSLLASGAKLWNVYGPTETTVWSLAGEVCRPALDASPRSTVPLGRPIDSTPLRIVDSRGRDVPEGVPGELWIGGLGVARGYRNAELNRQRFVDVEGRRMYRTGDRVRLNPDGAIEFLGRLDRQIKLRGHRIELGEIESAMNDCEAVVQAAVTTVGESSSDRRLVAFYATAPDTTLPAAELRRRLEQRLPAAMIPSALIPLSEIPHTPAGKIDYRKLPTDSCLAVIHSGSHASAGSRPPATATEIAVAQAWSEVLGVDAVSSEDDFFELGGHSLTAAQVFARLRSRFGVALPLQEIYRRRTPAGLAAAIDERLSETAGDIDDLSSFVARSCGSQPDAQLLSPAEQRLWFVDQLEPNHPFYNLPLAALLQGPLDVDRLTAAFNDCAARHETLRSTYRVVDGRPVREVADAISLVPQVIDLSGKPGAEALARRQMQVEARRPFDLAEGPLIRLAVWRLGDDSHLLLLVMHHIISDGWSMGVMLRELTEFYRSRTEGTPPRLAPLPASYRQYAAWQAERLSAERIEPSLEYWQQQLDGAPETLDLPTDFPRPRVQGFDGASLPLALPAELSDRIDAAAQRLGVTPFSVLLASYGLMLSRISRQRDLTIGTAVANRTDPAVEAMIGFFVNTVVLRQRTTGSETFAEHVRRMHGAASEAIDHGDIPFEQVVSRLARRRDRSHSPLFQTALVLQNAPRPELDRADLQVKPIDIDNATAKYDLTVLLDRRGDGYHGRVEFRNELFRPETVQRYCDAWLTLLEEGLQRPDTATDDLSLIHAADQARVITRGVGPVVRSRRSETLHGRVREAATRFPAAMAIRHGDRFVTYSELDQRAEQLAWGLRSRGVGRGERVLVCLPRSIDQIAGCLAVMRCGAAFVPVDPQVPSARVASIAAGLEPALIIAEGRRIADLKAARVTAECCSAGDLAGGTAVPFEDAGVTPLDPAYLIFTSGSTGTPKGVAVPHGAICNFIEGFAAAMEIRPGMRCSHLFSPSFDGAVGEVFPVLSSGGCLEIVDQEIAVDPPRLASLLTDRRIELVMLTPATLAMLRPQDLAGTKKILSAGAALSGELAGRWLKTHRLYNGYGPTECAVGATVARLDDTDLPLPSVGRPLPNTRVYVLDSRRRPVPDGVVGEVYIAGSGAAGCSYFRDPVLTQQRFVIDPFAETADADGNLDASAAIMYRTGDLGRWNRGGRLEIVGRADDQIKLRGFRIEPAEIVAALDQVPGVSRAAVIARADEDDMQEPASPERHAERNGNVDRKRLVAYVVPEPDTLHRGADANGQDASQRTPEEQQHIANWLTLFDNSQGAAGLGVDPADDFSGWAGVITGRPFPLDQMRRWADAAAGRILDLRPRRVLEVGCGSGLMLFRIAEHLEHYTGVDMLESALEKARRGLQQRNGLGNRVELLNGAADELEDSPGGPFDTVVLNSVVQYFPSRDYLIRVLQKVERLLAPGGRIFLGDLRNLRLHEAFAVAAELPRSAESTPCGRFLQRVRSRMQHDEELLVDPDLEKHLRPHLERLCGVDLLPKATGDANELTRFRFDAVLHLDRHEPMTAADPRETGDRGRPGDTDSVPEVATLLSMADCLRTLDPAQPLSDAHPNATAQDVRPHASAPDVRPVYPDAATAVSHGVSPQPDAWTNHPPAQRQAARLIERIKNELRGRLPAYMVPSAFVLVDDLPLTIQGKLNRAALPPPPTVRLHADKSLREPRSEHESLLVEIWEELLDVSPIGIDDDFFELGGHSMLAVRMVAAVQQRSGATLPLAALFSRPTIARLAELLEMPASPAAEALVPLAVGEGEPLICIHPAGGTVFCYQELAALLGGRFRVYGLQARGLDGRMKPHEALDAMAGDYAAVIRDTIGGGRYHLLGWSLGGNIAYEVARRLRGDGDSVGLLALLDSGRIAESDSVSEEDFLPLISALFPGGDHAPLDRLREAPPEQQLQYFIERAALAGLVPQDAAQTGAHIFDVFQANVQAVHRHRNEPYDGDLLLIRPQDQLRTGVLFDDPTLGWRDLAAGVELARVPGDHAHMLQRPAVQEVAKFIRERLAPSLECGVG